MKRSKGERPYSVIKRMLDRIDVFAKTLIGGGLKAILFV